jgi:hypothetical protein
VERLINRIDRLIDIVVGMRIARHQRRRDNSVAAKFLQEQGAVWLRRYPVSIAATVYEIGRAPGQLE